MEDILDRKFEDAFSEYMMPKKLEEDEKMSISQRNTANAISTTGNGQVEADSRCSKPYGVKVAGSPANT